MVVYIHLCPYDCCEDDKLWIHPLSCPPLFYDLRVFHIDPSFSGKLLFRVLDLKSYDLEKYNYEQILMANLETEDFSVLIVKNWKNIKPQLESTAN